MSCLFKTAVDCCLKSTFWDFSKQWNHNAYVESAKFANIWCQIFSVCRLPQFRPIKSSWCLTKLVQKRNFRNTKRQLPTVKFSDGDALQAAAVRSTSCSCWTRLEQCTPSDGASCWTSSSGSSIVWTWHPIALASPSSTGATPPTSDSPSTNTLSDRFATWLFTQFFFTNFLVTEVIR